MITVQIKGGLGNQLFQYALALSLKHRLKAELALDTSFFASGFTEAGPTLRKLDLDSFRISLKDRLSSGTPFQKDLISKLRRLFERKLLPYYKNSYVKEQVNGFDPDILLVRDGSFLDGYWQSPLYFADIADILRQDLQLAAPFGSAARSVSEAIQAAGTTVSLHVRRGDYVSKYQHLYNILGPEYYTEALRILRERLPQQPLNVFVFSDDIEWCRQHLRCDHTMNFVTGADISIAEELMLMAQCDHNIIANSSFSWWGAWLNNKPGHLTVAPRKWFCQPDQNFDSTIYPETWIRL